jgi:DNA-binding response OmpR family regulator
MAGIALFSDDSILAAGIARAVAAKDLRVDVFAAGQLGESVREALRQRDFELVLLELAPTLSNTHLLVFLRADELTRALPVILLSALPDIAELAITLGADGGLQLPASAEQILQAILRLRPGAIAHAVGAPRTMPASSG